MSTAPPLIPKHMSVEEYLRTSFEGSDLEYLDGELVERNMGSSHLSHSRIQALLASMLIAEEKRTGLPMFRCIRAGRSNCPAPASPSGPNH